MPSVHFKNSKQSLERLKMTTYRVHLKVWTDKKKAPVKAFAFLNDIKKGRVNFFIEKKIAIAKTITITFGENSETLRGVVVWMKRYSKDKRYVGHSKANWRCGIRFEFSSDSEKQRYYQFLEEKRRQILSMVPGALERLEHAQSPPAVDKPEKEEAAPAAEGEAAAKEDDSGEDAA